jgi:hypothetical protein
MDQHSDSDLIWLIEESARVAAEFGYDR